MPFVPQDASAEQPEESFVELAMTACGPPWHGLADNEFLDRLKALTGDADSTLWTVGSQRRGGIVRGRLRRPPRPHENVGVDSEVGGVRRHPRNEKERRVAVQNKPQSRQVDPSCKFVTLLPSFCVARAVLCHCTHQERGRGRDLRTLH